MVSLSLCFPQEESLRVGEREKPQGGVESLGIRLVELVLNMWLLLLPERRRKERQMQGHAPSSILAERDSAAELGFKQDSAPLLFFRDLFAPATNRDESMDETRQNQSEKFSCSLE